MASPSTTNELDELVQRYFQNLSYREETVEDDGGMRKQYAGHIDGEELYNSFMSDLKALGYVFSTENSNLNKSSRIVFSFEQKNADIRIPYFGSPFQVVRSIYKVCSQGGSIEPRRPPKFFVVDYPVTKKPRRRNKPSKKTGCPAFMTVKCLRVFDDDQYKASGYKKGSAENSRILVRLYKDLRLPTPPAGTLRYLILLSSARDHNHEIVAANLNHRLDPRLKEEIYRVTRSGVRSVEAVREHLARIVRETFDEAHPRPHAHNRCYYPVDKVIRFHMGQALSNSQNECDQEALEDLVGRRARECPNDCLFYRPYRISGGGVSVERKPSTEPASSTLLLCHQTRWQRHLLRRYGHEVCLLDAAYKTCMYSFPLYFLVARTNCGECVVGTFVVQRETTVLIEEALVQFKAWNPDWDPEYFATDNSEASLTALAQAFPQTTVYVHPFYREQAWQRWLNKKGSVRKRAIITILTLWQTVAFSQTREEYIQRIQSMYDDEMYQESVHAQRYFSVEWLPIHQTWVEAYHTDQYISRINMNNGGESLNEALQHTYLSENGEKSLSGVIRLVLEKVLPDVLEKYSRGNVSQECREFNDAVPEFLKSRPIPFIENVMLRFLEAQSYDASHVTEMGDGLFVVRSEPEADEWCSVDFHEAVCSCPDFGRWRLPCKHMCAVFRLSKWGFDGLSSAYRDHPFISADDEFPMATMDDGSTSVGIGEAECVDMKPDIFQGRDLAEPEHDDTPEFNDVKKLMDTTREKLKMLHGYTYLQYDPVNASKFAEAVSALEEEMSLAARKSIKGLSLRPTDCIVPVKKKKFLPLKCGKVKYFTLPCDKAMLPLTGTS